MVLNTKSISISETGLTREELKAELEGAFPQYKCKIFGIGLGKRVIVVKSATIGVSVSIKGDRLTLHVAQPSLLASGLLNFALGIGNILVMRNSNSMVDEVGDFLVRRYGKSAEGQS